MPLVIMSAVHCIYNKGINDGNPLLYLHHFLKEKRQYRLLPSVYSWYLRTLVMRTNLPGTLITHPRVRVIYYPVITYSRERGGLTC